MRKIYFILLAICIISFTGCNQKPKVEGKYSKYFSSEEPVDLSDVVKIYEKAEKDSAHYDVLSALLGKKSDSYNYMLVISDTSSAIHLPQYAKNTQPFLSKAEDFYNSCQYAFNIWSDYELWLTTYSDWDIANKEEVEAGIKGISENCIRDSKMRVAARKYKEDLLKQIENASEDGDEAYNKGSEILNNFITSFNTRAYKFYNNEDKFVDSLDSMAKELRNTTKDIYDEYARTDSLKRNVMMLKALNNCETFDEQCSLLLNWADSKLSYYDDEWIEAVAYRLIDSGKYNPCLNDIWILWRSQFQTVYCGSSHGSCIPNDFYNKVREKCYLTCLKRINAYPKDVFAMNCAASIGGRCNLERFGRYPFGNQAAADEIEILPTRYDN